MSRPRNLPIDIRDQRIPGGRLSISSGTPDAAARDAYRASIVAVLDNPRVDEIVRRLRLTRAQAGAFTPGQLHEAVRSMDLPSLLAAPAPAPDGAAAPAGVPPAMLGATVNQFLQRIRSDNAKSTAEQYTMSCASMEAAFGVHRAQASRPDEDRYEQRPIIRDVAVREINFALGQAWLKGGKETLGGKPWGAQRQATAHSCAQQVWAIALAQEEDAARERGGEWRPWRNFWAQDRVRAGSTVRPAKKQHTRIVFLDRRQAAAILWATRGTRLAAWCAVGLYAGLRISETRYLRPRIDVDLQRATLHVQARKGDFPWRPKNRKDRDVEMSTALARWLRRHVRDGYAGERFFFRPLTGADRPIGRNTGFRWTEEAFTGAGIKYGGRSGDAVSYHTLRHTFASWLAMLGYSPKMIAELLGDTVKVVMDTYIHLWPHQRRAAVEGLRQKGGAR